MTSNPFKLIPKTNDYTSKQINCARKEVIKPVKISNVATNDEYHDMLHLSLEQVGCANSDSDSPFLTNYDNLS